MVMACMQGRAKHQASASEEDVDRRLSWQFSIWVVATARSSSGVNLVRLTLGPELEPLNRVADDGLCSRNFQPFKWQGAGHVWPERS